MLLSAYLKSRLNVTSRSKANAKAFAPCFNDVGNLQRSFAIISQSINHIFLIRFALACLGVSLGARLQSCLLICLHSRLLASALTHSLTCSLNGFGDGEKENARMRSVRPHVEEISKSLNGYIVPTSIQLRKGRMRSDFSLPQ